MRYLTPLTGYGLMARPVTMSFIAVAAYASPKLEENRKRPAYLGTVKYIYRVSVRHWRLMFRFIGNLVLAGNFIEKTKRKMRVILYLALANGHDSVVLSAMGCGAYKNPPGYVSVLTFGLQLTCNCIAVTSLNCSAKSSPRSNSGTNSNTFHLPFLVSSLADDTCIRLF